MNIPEPTQIAFNTAEDAAVNILQDYNKQIDSKKGSIVRELVIRPVAYIYARVNEILSNWVRRTSISYLSGTDDTSDSIADLVASNYFVTRKAGNYAKGIVTLNCTESQVRISRNTSFFIAQHEFVVQKSYIATSSTGTDSAELGYIKMINLGTTDAPYKANLPVIASQPGTIEIPAGADVDVNSYIAGCDSASLLSPITGGSTAETNAQMMERCKQRCGAAVGTLEAIRTKMQEAPVDVISCNAQGSAEPGCFRSRKNSVALPMGGVIDIYAKTRNQNEVTDLYIDQLESDSSSNPYFVQLTTINQPEIAGACRITAVNPYSDSLSSVGDYTVTFGSSTEVSPAGARGSVDQTITIRFNDLTRSVPVCITVEYMPGVKDLQDFIDNEYQKFLGQDCQIKAAIPATLEIKGQLFSQTALTQSVVQQIKEAIALRINSKLVGDYNLNMDKVAQAVEASFPDIKLRLPYTINIAMPTTNGGVYTARSEDGTISLLYRDQLYLYSEGAYFFSVSPSNIELLVSE